MARKSSKLQVSLSAEKSEVDALISALLVLLLNVNEKNTVALRADFKEWSKASMPFLKELDIAPEVVKVFNIFTLKNDIFEEHAIELGSVLKSVKDKLTRDTTISTSKLKLLNDCILSLHKDSLPAWNRIVQAVSILGNPKLSMAFSGTSVDAGNEPIFNKATVERYVKTLKPLVFKTTGRTGSYYMTPKELLTLKAHEKDYLAYISAARELTKIVKAEIQKFVRMSGDSKVHIEKVKTHLESLGLIHNLPRNYPLGYVDDHGKFYTMDGLLLDKIPVGTMVINPKYVPGQDNTYVMHSLEFGPSSRCRTLQFLTGKKKARHSVVKDFIEEEQKYRAKWLMDLNKPNTKEQVFATIIELLHATSARIGGAGNATAGEPTYGLTTLLVEHTQVLANKVTFNYIGKKLAPQPATYLVKTPEGKKIQAIMKKLVTGKKPSDHVFTWNGSPVQSQYIRAYLKSLQIELSPHRFRNIAATKLAQKLCLEGGAKFKRGSVKQTDVDRWVKEEFIKIGEVLHHRTGEKTTGMTAIKSYIDPFVLEDFYTSLGLRIPKFVPGHEKD